MRHTDENRPAQGTVRYEVEWAPVAPPNMDGTDDADIDAIDYHTKQFSTQAQAIAFAEKQSSFFGCGPVTEQTYMIDPGMAFDNDGAHWNVLEWIDGESIEIEMPWRE